ncbi:hypothetical protein Q668_17305 [Alcanivorax sp. PN-3]|nr:hypothetical protein Q668_17305 [Alcanivorax sp. PN-3]
MRKDEVGSGYPEMSRWTLSQRTGERLALAIYTVIAVAMLVWPFSYELFKSQLVGLILLLPIALRTKLSFSIARSMVSWSWAVYLVLFFGVALHLLLGENNSELPLFMAYVVKIPIVYCAVNLTYQTLLSSGWSRGQAQCWLWAAVVVPLIVTLCQLLFPSFHNWSIDVLGGFRVSDVIARHAEGHPFRFFGLNGFLFASHAVAYGFCALALCIVRGQLASPIIRAGLFLVEMSCLLMALLAGRSALPLVALYVLYSLWVAKQGRVRFLLVVFYIMFFALAVLILQKSDDGRKYLYWLAEPVLTSIEKGRLASHSVDETLDSYAGISRSEKEKGCQSTIKQIVGCGVYFRSNAEYAKVGLVASDSGYVRFIYAVGYLGLGTFIAFLIMILCQVVVGRDWLKKLKENLFCVFFLIYGFVFLFKSEWMYQNYFVFYYFLLVVLRKEVVPDYGSNVRESVLASS